jgi:hypothetical protein
MDDATNWISSQDPWITAAGALSAWVADPGEPLPLVTLCVQDTRDRLSNGWVGSLIPIMLSDNFLIVPVEST